MRRLKGAPIDAVAAAVEGAVAKEDLPILQEIAAQVEHFHGARVTETHGFVRWFWLLRDGVGALPERLPRLLLERWRDAYCPKFGLDGSPWCPNPFWRCEDCKLILPHCPGWDGPCPSCDSPRIFHADHSRRLGQRWLDQRLQSRNAS